MPPVVKKHIKLQTEKVKDITKSDWAQSKLFKRIMYNEAKLRNLDYKSESTDIE